MTLTIKCEVDMVLVDFYVKFLVLTLNGSVMRVHIDAHMEGHTDGSDSINPTADAKGNSFWHSSQR